MRTALLLALVAVPTLAAQPVAPTGAASAAVGVRLERWAAEPPITGFPVRRPDRSTLYYVGVGLDVAVFAVGSGMAAAGVVALAGEQDGFSALPATFALTVGATLATVAGVDLVRVARGGQPILVRAGDRRPPRRGPLR